ncbi:LytR C-terminal domain-containing protein [Chlorobium sp. N1]|uniref:LytR C-terminal domain-containing protein n=1 Tax=Chlorobium sp. N1 TaxID=2491138 RepID=UPI0010396193|nr:LytR C-terminal domain-containing protein [Chlorobium sp. N1]TCD47413.1 LytR family transcriptional regulator [Chlorobium sp. N1]
MKHFLTILVLLLIAVSPLRADEHGAEIPPYIRVGVAAGSVDAVAGKVTEALKTGGFEILGTYNPENNPGLCVIAFTRGDLKAAAVKVQDRGALAAVLKVGLVKKTNGVTVSYLNPPYIFNAYLRKEATKQGRVLDKVTTDLKAALGTLGSEFAGFGGGIRAEKLWKYRYKFMMPNFDDPEELNTYESFEAGVATISAHLKENSVHAREVYRLVYPAEKTAVFGIALLDPEEGEGMFLPKIGEGHIAAMPYEMILQGDTVTMLPGRYRIALSWPDLSMGTFMKIMSTPGDIKDMMRSLTE